MSQEVVEVGALSLISFFSQRAEQVRLSAQYVKSKTTAVQNFLTASSSSGYSAGSDVASRKITLELSTNAQPVNSNDQAESSSGLRTIGQVRNSLASLVTFDVGLSADGYAQVIEQSAMARQTVHQTAVGFYVDEFNEAAGSLSVDVEVLFRGYPASQIQHFFNQLHRAKKTDPQSNEPPYRLRYFDSYLDRALEITQDSIRIRIDAERPNRARLTIAATVLYDYSSTKPTTATEPVSAAAVSASATSNALLALSQLGAFTTPTGSSV